MPWRNQNSNKSQVQPLPQFRVTRLLKILEAASKPNVIHTEYQIDLLYRPQRFGLDHTSKYHPPLE
jgi:hypothetical protein